MTKDIMPEGLLSKEIRNLFEAAQISNLKAAWRTGLTVQVSGKVNVMDATKRYNIKTHTISKICSGL